MLWIFYIIHQLRSIEQAILKMTESFYRMKEGCKPRTFYNCIRPFLAGSNGNPSVPAGVIYDGCYGNTPQKYNGGSAAQSTLFPVFDAIFDISHEDIPGPNSFLKEMQRFYMPREHGDFVVYLHRNSKRRSIKSYISMLEKMSVEDPKFNHALSEMKKRYNFFV